MQEYRYLLDTNILTDLVRSPAGIVADRLVAAGEGLVCTSIVVACELRFGAEEKVLHCSPQESASCYLCQFCLLPKRRT